MKIIVVGPDDFDDYSLVKDTLDIVTLRLDMAKLLIMTFGAHGPNRLFHKWCFHNLTSGGTYCIYHPYKSRKATRRERCAAFERADALVAFWDMADEEVEGYIQQAKDNWIHRIKVVPY